MIRPPLTLIAVPVMPPKGTTLPLTELVPSVLLIAVVAVAPVAPLLIDSDSAPAVRLTLQLVLAPPMLGLVTVLKPVIVVLDATARLILRALRIEPKDEVGSSFTREEVAALVEESRGEGLLDEEEAARLSGALDFTERTIAEVMMAPESLATVARGASGADVEALCAATGFSRFPVVDPEAPDEPLIGYLHIKDVLEPDEARRLRPIADRWIRPFAAVSPDQPLHVALEHLQRRGAHMARIVDEAGATLGVAALEDVIEELVGEIRDGAHSDDATAAGR